MRKQNIPFLVHVEEMFRDYFPDPMYTLRLKRAVQALKYDKVFLMVSGVEDDHPIQELVDVTYEDQYIDWGWGYEPDMFNDVEKSWIIPALGHEWTWIPPELRNDHFDHVNIFVGGGCESECLQDFCDILDHLNLYYKKIRGYIY